MKSEHEQWKSDQEAENEIRGLLAVIDRALESEAFKDRAAPKAQRNLLDARDQLRKDAAHIVAVWD